VPWNPERYGSPIMTDTQLYIIGNDEEKTYKIGISNNPDSRLKSIQTGCPFPLSLIKQYNLGGYASSVEKIVHHFLENNNNVKSMVGEWFSCSVKDVDDIVQKELVIHQQRTEKEEKIRKKKEEEKLEKEKQIMLKATQELEKKMKPLLFWEEKLRRKFSLLRKTERQIVEMSKQLEECRKILNRKQVNKELQTYYRNKVDECIGDIKNMQKQLSNPQSYGGWTDGFYNRVLDLFHIFRRRKIVKYSSGWRRGYSAAEHKDDVFCKSGNKESHVNFLKPRYLNLEEFNNFVLICRRKNYLGYTFFHFDRDGDYYLEDFEKDENYATIDLSYLLKDKGEITRFLKYVEKNNGKLE